MEKSSDSTLLAEFKRGVEDNIVSVGFALALYAGLIGASVAGCIEKRDRDQEIANLPGKRTPIVSPINGHPGCSALWWAEVTGDKCVCYHIFESAPGPNERGCTYEAMQSATKIDCGCDSL